jgi:hypothetical protein
MNSLTQDIQDILIDLVDDNYHVEVRYYPYNKVIYINKKKKVHDSFEYTYLVEISRDKINNIDDKLSQLFSYMDSNGYGNYKKISAYLPIGKGVPASSREAIFIYFAKWPSSYW